MIKEINLKNILIFTLPSIASMLFLSFYTMVDGIFVANLISQDALSAINITLPIVFTVSSIGMMISTGGCAIYAKLLGEGKKDEAREKLTLFTMFGIITGLLLTFLVTYFADDILIFLGADKATYSYSSDYALNYMIFAPAVILQMIFQTAIITEGKPTLSLICMLLGGFTNIVLDYVFIGILEMGISGAALATGIGNSIGAIIGLVFFSTKRKYRILSFKKFKFDFHSIYKMCINGSSEMVTNLSNAIVTLLFNQTMLKLAGNDGVAAITVILYAQFFVNSVFLGYSMGISPVISYYFGEMNKENLQKIFKISMKFLSITSVAMIIMAFLIKEPMSSFFLEKGSYAYTLSIEGMDIFAIGFLFSGFNIFASAMFTAYSNGKISAIISFLRTFLLIVASILILPAIIGITGVWLAVPAAEILSLVISIYFIRKYRSKYLYGNAIGNDE